jgi:hypothetical protein
MTYTIEPVSNITEIPALISDFAVARGWSSSGDGIITHPLTGRTYTITAGSRLVTVACTGTSITAVAKMPYVGAGSPVEYDPTQVHIFGNNSPYDSPDTEPFIAFVVECGYNRYRHFYIGSIVKAGNYTDGDLFSCNNHSEYFTSVSTLDITSSRQRYMFRGYCNATRAGGGARIVHAANATTWRDFAGPIDGGDPFEETMDGTEVYGGNMDGVNDGRVYRGSVNFGAAQLLVPVSLYVSKGDLGADYRFIPVGHASGVRLVDMVNLTPGQQCMIGGDAWRVFPEFRKSTARTVSKVTSPDHWSEETSYYLGLAYRE